MASARQLALGSIDGRDMRASVTDFTFTTPYPTGGDTLTPSQYGMSSIVFVSVECPYVGGGYQAVYNPSTGKVQLFGSGSAHWGTLDEVQNATVIGAVTARLLILGKPA